MYKPSILPPAKQDIKKATQWYNAKQNGLGKRFTDQVRKKVKYICDNPQAIALRHGDTRCCLLEVFPFMIHFYIEESQKQVIIAAIFHTSLNPENWNRSL